MSIFLMLAATPSTAHNASESAGLPQMDASTFPSQLFWLAITFGLLYWIISSFVLPRIGGAIEERRDRIADDLDQAAEFRQHAEEAETAYNEALTDATTKARAIAADTRETLKGEIAEMSTEADRESADALAKAEERIAAMKADASEKVREAAVELSRAIVAALIDETPTAEAAEAAMPERLSA